MKKITKALITVAGMGTRRLPITKAVEKCMLPICNRPVVDYIVEDCIKAGAKDIYLVINPDSTQIKQYFDENKKLEQFLLDNNKSDMLPLITPPRDVNFHYVVQEIQNGSLSAYGKVFEEFDINEPIICSSGDDVIYRSDGGSDMVDLVASLGDRESGMLAKEIDREKVGKYGVLSLDGDYLRGFVEKPSPEQAPSNLINVVKWVFIPEIVNAIRLDYKTRDYTPDKEHHYIEALVSALQRGHKLKVKTITGEYLDGGSLEGWLHANEIVGKDLLKKS